jgi:polynucleotide 5'-kinase involved in rRNA processing
MRFLFLLFSFSLNVIFSHAQVNDSIVNVLIDRYLKKSPTGIDNSIVEVNDSIYINVVRNLQDSFLNTTSKEETLYVQFNDVVFNNSLLVENELNKMSVSDRLPNRNTNVFTINEALIDGELCFISVAIQSLDHHKKQLITSEFIYYILRKKEGKYVIEKIIEDSF